MKLEFKPQSVSTPRSALLERNIQLLDRVLSSAVHAQHVAPQHKQLLAVIQSLLIM
jgi:hypothetical protein